MKIQIKRTKKLKGKIQVLASKSHTIRALVLACLANGKSIIKNPLESKDAQACLKAIETLGAKVEKKNNEYHISGLNANLKIVNNRIDTMNSGTTTNLIMSVCCLSDREIIINGDESIQKRPVDSLIYALNNLGAIAESIKNNKCPPIRVKGKLKGGSTDLNCKSSQYLSSLLITCPFIENDTLIKPYNICEKPYIDMTLKWLEELNIKYENNNYESFLIYGRQQINGFEKTISGDWSTATFLLIAGVLLGEEIIIKGLDMNDTQADKKVLEYLKLMGAKVSIQGSDIIIKKSKLKGCALDLNETPDALPAMSVLACFAQGRTRIKNVAHARLKETDRIKVMAKELRKMNANIRETQDGLIIEQSKLHAADLNGYYDHRVVMALSIAGLLAEGATTVNTAEAVSVTYPDFVKDFNSLGADFKLIY